MRKSPRVLFVGGPTGGHLQPGLALANALVERAGLAATFFTCGRDIEREVFQGNTRVELQAMPQLRRARPYSPLAWWRAHRAVTEFFAGHEIRALVALGGGESLVPAAVAARRGSPVFLLEQNRVLGRANRWLLRRATRVFLSFEDTQGPRLLKRRALRTGCPVRPGFMRQPLPQGPPGVLVLGGSQGSQDVNEWAVSSLAASVGLVARVVHVCGPGKSGDLSTRYRRAGVEAEVVEYETDVATRLTECHLVIARSGGSTVAEIAAVGRPAIFLPYPHHRDRQQFLNAEYLVERGAALICGHSVSELSEHLQEVLSDVDRLAEMAQAASGGVSDPAAQPAAVAIADTIATHLEEFPVQLCGTAAPS